MTHVGNSTNKLNVKKTACLLLAATLCTGTAAWASKPSTDEFHSNAASNVRLNPAPAPLPIPQRVEDNPVAQAGAKSLGQDHPVKRWFDNLDGVIGVNLKTPKQAITLRQGFNGNVERVEKWSNTASEVSQRYKLLAAKLRGTPVPPGCPDLKDYLEMNANWFDDTAEIYDELLKPRQPAKTQEELDEQLQEIRTKAQGLKRTKEQLRSFDTEIRKQYKVPEARYEDFLRQYVEGQNK